MKANEERERDLEDLEGTVGTEPEGEVGVLLDAHRLVGEEELVAEMVLREVENCEEEDKVEERVFPVF